MLHLLTYPACIDDADPGDVVVTFPDIPEAITGGSSRDEAIANAADALDVALEGYLLAGRRLPDRRPAAATEVDIALAPAIAARAVLLETMRAKGLNNVGLAKLLGRDEKVVRRIVSGHGATLDLTLKALRAVGVRAGLAA